MSRIGSRLRDPEAGPRHFRGPRQVGDDSGDLGVARGRVPKVPEKAGRVSLDFVKTRPRVPPRGHRGKTPTFWGSGHVGVELYRPWGAPGQGPEGP